jgi:hypothetical protein
MKHRTIYAAMALLALVIDVVIYTATHAPFQVTVAVVVHDFMAALFVPVVWESTRKTSRLIAETKRLREENARIRADIETKKRATEALRSETLRLRGTWQPPRGQA